MGSQMRLYASIVRPLTYLFLMYPKEPLWPRWFPEQAVANAFAVLFVLNALTVEAAVAKTDSWWRLSVRVYGPFVLAHDAKGALIIDPGKSMDIFPWRYVPKKKGGQHQRGKNGHSFWVTRIVPK